MGQEPVSLALNQVATHPQLDPKLRDYLTKAVQQLGSNAGPMSSAMTEQDVIRRVPMNYQPFARTLFGTLSNSLAAQQAGNGQ